MALKISLNEDQAKFKFTTDAKDLDAAIARASSVVAAAGSNVKNFILAGSNGSLILMAFNPDTYVLMQLKGKSEGDGSFGFLPATLSGIIKGRGEINFKFTGAECEFKQTKGNYSGKIVTQPVTSDQISILNTKFASVSKKKDAKLKIVSPSPSILPRNVLDHLKEGVAITGIKDVYTSSALLSYMQLTEKGILTVSSFDNHHFGRYRVKVDAGGMTFKAALPSSHFLIIDKMCEGEEAKFHVSNENIRVEGDNFTLILPSTQTEDKNYSLIGDFIKALEAPSFECVYDNDKLLAMADNLFTLHSVNTSFEISHVAKSKELSVTFTTANGSASDKLKIVPISSKSLTAKVDPRMLKDILALFKGQKEAKFSIVPEAVIHLQAVTKLGAAVSLISALSG